MFFKRTAVLFLILCALICCSCSPKQNDATLSDTTEQAVTESGTTVQPSDHTAEPTTDSTSAVIETLSYVPFDDVDYTLEKIELPYEDGYETTVMGYIRMVYEEQGSLGMTPHGILDNGRTDFLSEQERILPGYHPEKLSVMAKKPISVSGTFSLNTYINSPSTPLEPFTKFDLRLTQRLSGEYYSQKYNENSDMYYARTDSSVFFVQKYTLDEENRYIISFDDGTYFFELFSLDPGISLDEIMKVVVSLNRPCRTVEDNPGAGDTLSFPGTEKIDLKYTPDYKATNGKYWFCYDGFSNGFAYQARGEQGNYEGHMPQLAGFCAKLTDSGDIRFTNDNGDFFVYRMDKNSFSTAFTYGDGTSFYKLKVGEFDAIVLFDSTGGVQKGLGLFFSDGENDYSFQTGCSGIGLQQLIDAAKSIGNGELPKEKESSIYYFSEERKLSPEKNDAFAAFAVIDYGSYYVFSITSSYHKNDYHCFYMGSIYGSTYRDLTGTQTGTLILDDSVNAYNVPGLDGSMLHQRTIYKDALKEGNFFGVSMEYSISFGGPGEWNPYFALTYENSGWKIVKEH